MLYFPATVREQVQKTKAQLTINVYFCQAHAFFFDLTACRPTIDEQTSLSFQWPGNFFLKSRQKIPKNRVLDALFGPF